MKYRIFIIILFLVTFSLLNVSSDSHELTIYIDPGHGGIDPGTCVAETLEKDLNLQISLLLKEKLEKENIKVLLTRDGDYDLSSPSAMYRKKSDFDNRISLINKSSANMYISIHMNYLEDKSYSGIQVFGTPNNLELASYLQNALNNKLNGRRESKEISNKLYMYRQLNKPGVLIECGFLSNEMERNKLKTHKYQTEISSAIYTAIINYYQKIYN